MVKYSSEPWFVSQQKNEKNKFLASKIRFRREFVWLKRP